MSNFVCGITEAFIIIISITIAAGVLNLPGNAGTFLQLIAAYLPRLLGGILIIVLGLVLVDFLAALGKVLKPMFTSKPEIADMLKNLLFIGLIAVKLNIAFDLMMLSSGSLVYSLILGFVIIGAGIILTEGLIKSILKDHKEFGGIAGYAQVSAIQHILVDWHRSYLLDILRGHWHNKYSCLGLCYRIRSRFNTYCLRLSKNDGIGNKIVSFPSFFVLKCK